jgi:hypothetical protein
MKLQRRFKKMSILSPARFLRPQLGKQALVLLLSFGLVCATWPGDAVARQDQQPPVASQDQVPPPGGQSPQDGQAPPYAQQTPEQLQRLVAPIALYPDSLVAQILAAATFPEQVVEADRWVQTHPDLKGEALGKEVDTKPWDPSVKALTGFPSVLGNMDKNISWTSSLGDAYYNQQQDIMDAVQVMRRRAQQAGNLKDTPQQKVVDKDSSVVIEPVQPDVVYVPAYDPWLVYGGPIVAWPGWYPYPGIWFDGPFLSFGLGFGIGWYGGFGWGWGGWGFDWHHRYALYGGGRYYSRSRTFYNRDAFYRGGNRGNFRPGGAFGGDRNAARGYADRGGDRGNNRGGSRGQSGVRSGAFSGYNRGGQARGFSSRGQSSFGGGGFHGGGGGGRHR